MCLKGELCQILTLETGLMDLDLEGEVSITARRLALAAPLSGELLDTCECSGSYSCPY